MTYETVDQVIDMIAELQSENARLKEKLNLLPLDWDTEVEAYKAANDALRSEVTALRAENRENQMEWQKMLATALERIAELEGALEALASWNCLDCQAALRPIARAALEGKLYHTAGHGYERGDTAEEVHRGGAYRSMTDDLSAKPPSD